MHQPKTEIPRLPEEQAAETKYRMTFRERLSYFFKGLLGIRTIPPNVVPSYLDLFLFYLPLAIMQLFVVFTHTLANVGLASLKNAEVCIAGYVVATNYTDMLQSPVYMMNTLVPTLVTDRASYRKVYRFFLGIMGTIFVLTAVLNFTGASRFILREWLSTTGDVLEMAVVCSKVLTVLCLVMLSKNFFSGFAIRVGKNYLITLATIMRMIVVATFVEFMPLMNHYVSGAVLSGTLFVLAGGAQTLSVIIGLILVYGSITNGIVDLERQLGTAPVPGETNKGSSLKYMQIILFFLPLTVVALVEKMGPVFMNSALARTPDPALVLASYGVGWNIVALFAATAQSYQNMPIIFGGIPASRKKLFRFTLLFGGFLSLGVAALALTPLGSMILRKGVGVSDEVAAYGSNLLLFAIPYPFLTVMNRYLMGSIMRNRKTILIMLSKALNISALFAVLYGLSKLPLANPTIMAPCALVAAEGTECLYYSVIKWLRRRYYPELEGVVQPA